MAVIIKFSYHFFFQSNHWYHNNPDKPYNSFNQDKPVKDPGESVARIQFSIMSISNNKNDTKIIMVTATSHWSS